MKGAYPVIFTDVDTNILVEVPDLGILTEANEEGKAKGTIADAIEMARDAIGLACINLQDETWMDKFPWLDSDKHVRSFSV